VAVSSVVITVEGVLKKHVADAPIPVGIALYHGLANTFNVLLAADMEKKELDRWCALEGLNKHAAVEHNEGIIKSFDPDFRRLQQVKNLRQRGYSIDLVIEPNPSIVVKLLEHGFSCMTYTHASYSMPQWRPDYQHKIRPWDDILDYEIKMAELRAIEEISKEDKDNR